MAARRWSDLDPRVRKAIVGVGAAEAVLKVAALVDIRRRPADQIRGKKRNWALAMIVNSAGLIPLAYFLFGRRHDRLRPPSPPQHASAPRARLVLRANVTRPAPVCSARERDLRPSPARPFCSALGRWVRRIGRIS